MKQIVKRFIKIFRPRLSMKNSSDYQRRREFLKRFEGNG